jgi:hypothetical protein
MIKTRFNKNKNGKASPKKAGNQNRTGEMYFAVIETSRLRMIK